MVFSVMHSGSAGYLMQLSVKDTSKWRPSYTFAFFTHPVSVKWVTL